ncbi:MAG: type V CRISPR-associated protein Cas12b [Chthoniobacter sp.]|uniref:type V CRISPR-associated protein Cas12b n=1 Tax=Chthoniobacter sp. TaxID=2510640 RepID=UPI0032A94D4E
MNRIYQGRVSRVELPNPSAGRRTPEEPPWLAFHPDLKRARLVTLRCAELRAEAALQRSERNGQCEPKPAKPGALKEFDDLTAESRKAGRVVLWKHHRRFQDAVNFYLAAFAAFIPADCDNEDWLEFRSALVRSWEKFAGRQGSWSRPFAVVCKLVGCSPKASFDDFRRRLLSITGSKATDADRFAALEQIFRPVRELVGQLEEADQPLDDSLKGVAKSLSNKLSALASRVSGETPDDIKGSQHHRAHIAVTKVEGGGALVWEEVFAFKTTESSAEWPAIEARVEIPKVLEELIRSLDEKAATAKKAETQAKFSALARQLESQRASLKTWCDEPGTEWPAKKPTRTGRGGDDMKVAMLFALRPDLDGFREAFLVFNQKHLKTPATVTADAVQTARMASGVECRVFPLFCDLLTNRLNDEAIDKGVWWDFERQAFFEVFTKIGQFLITERKFAIRLKDAEAKIASVNSLKKTDARLQAVELLAQELAGDAVDEHGHPRLYSIRDRTLKSWPKVRKAWGELLAEQPNASLEMLVAKKNELQKRFRERFGSPALFDGLARFPEIWNHDEERDHLRTWADYVEACEEKEHLEAERTFAPAHARYSPRYFRWSETGNRRHLPLAAIGDDFVVEVDALDFISKKKSRLRLHFSAPRLLRDGLRGPNETLDEDDKDQIWMPPALRALVKERGWPCDKQTFSGTSVRLAPTSINDVQLVFEPTLDAEKLSAKWRTEFPFEPSRRKRDGAGDWVDAGLAWPKEGKTPRWLNAGKMSCLAVDLGLTNSAAWHVLAANAGSTPQTKDRLVHRLNPDSESPPWFVRSIASGIVRVAGEDRWVFRKITDYDRKSRSKKIRKALAQGDAAATHTFLPELSGRAGRNAEPGELIEAERLFAMLKPRGFDIDERIPDWKSRLTFPEQNDELIWGLKRLRSQLFRLHRWAEQLRSDTVSKSYQAALDNIANLTGDDPLVELKELTETLFVRISALAVDYLNIFRDLLPTVADRILPSRRGRCVWRLRPDGWHQMTLDESRPREDTLIAGQRGLSLIRLNQLRDLRQLAQSLNHRCRHKIGERYQMRRSEVVPEPFEGCRRTLEDAREDRAKQIAHEIFVAALGVELSPPPPDKKKRKQIESLHGVYRCLDRGPVNFIALEDLAPYGMSGRQGRRENRQLAAWAHRRIHKVLEELCQLVGLPIVLVQPDLTSHFSAKDHSAGFRAEEVRKGDSRYFLWKKRSETEDGADWREFIDFYVQLLPDHSLFLPKRGGEVFIPLIPVSNVVSSETFYHADLNAAYRIGLRALAHPNRAELALITWLPADNARLKPGKSASKKDVPYLVDVAGALGSKRHPSCRFPVVRRDAEIWEKIYGEPAWRRCMEINRRRILAMDKIPM